MKALAQVTAYRDAQKQIERLDGLESKHNDKCRDETREISTKYWDMKRKIEDRECKETRVIKKKKEKYSAKCKLERDPYHKVMNEMEDTFKLMDVHVSIEKNPERYEQAVEFYKDKRWQRAYWLHQKDYYEKH